MKTLMHQFDPAYPFTAPPLSDVGLGASVAGRATAVTLPPNSFLCDTVVVVGALVTVAVTAVPLELTTIVVFPELSVVMATNVAALPVPTVVDNPGVRARVADGPSVTRVPIVTVGCC